ncbi:MAG: recombinase RecA [Thermoplasmata archaeon YP2-bin.285]|uniref:Recombinase RecA n=1 Tax=Candidatus Sysuiplasma superficiale TaxID=2823368 RepID=A0A8J7YRG5_9ARCH|nr:recombinase RecA [Candidatus Sysuiplasma superficiale]
MGSDARESRIPTGVSDFDSILDGGLPPGSVVLLLGDVGSGFVEFAYTSAAKLSLAKERPESSRYLMGDIGASGRLPERMHYITFFKPKEEILQEILFSFNEEFHSAFERNVEFTDLSEYYFEKSVVPPSWVRSGAPFLRTDGKTLIDSIVDFLDREAQGSFIIIDSLTDLVINESFDIMDVVAMLRGIQRMSKKWKGIIYVLLTSGILEKRKEQMIIDSVDGVFVFEWSRNSTSSKRQRYIYVAKFVSLMPHLDEQRIARFATTLTSQSGLVVIDAERI